jgi:hypothetical protein
MKPLFSHFRKSRLAVLLTVVFAWAAVVCIVPQVAHACCQGGKSSHAKSEIPCCQGKITSIPVAQADKPTTSSGLTLDLSTPAPALTVFFFALPAKHQHALLSSYIRINQTALLSFVDS